MQEKGDLLMTKVNVDDGSFGNVWCKLGSFVHKDLPGFLDPFEIMYWVTGSWTLLFQQFSTYFYMRFPDPFHVVLLSQKMTIEWLLWGDVQILNRTEYESIKTNIWLNCCSLFWLILGDKEMTCMSQNSLYCNSCSVKQEFLSRTHHVFNDKSYNQPGAKLHATHTGD